MLTCENSVTKKKIEASKKNQKELRNLSNSGLLRCHIPVCHKKMKFRCGDVYVAHFAHTETCEYGFYEPETEQHIMGKKMLRDRLAECFPTADISLEAWIPETHQVADVLVTHPNGRKWAFEFQCSRISGRVWSLRHQKYIEAGVKDFWILSVTLQPNISISQEIRITDLIMSINNSKPDGEKIIYLDTKRKELYIFQGIFRLTPAVAYFLGNKWTNPAKKIPLDKLSFSQT
jgi:competence CoiA-like predicted nuclease